MAYSDILTGITSHYIMYVFKLGFITNDNHKHCLTNKYVIPIMIEEVKMEKKERIDACLVCEIFFHFLLVITKMSPCVY